MRKFTLFWLMIVLLAIGTACSTSSPSAPTAPAPTRTTAATPSAATTPSTTLTYTIQDPSFQAITGTKVYFGDVQGSGYRMEVPDKWNGDLVLYAHGYRGVTTTLTVSNLPVREAAVQQGYAWAASSYHANGYNPEDGVQDTLALLDLFKQKISAPKRTYIYGTSMGGHVVVASVEQYPNVYTAGLSECGVVSGIGEFDYLLSYVLLGGYFAGVDFTAPENRTAQAATALLNQKVLPVLGTSPDKLSDKGKQFRSAVINLTGGHRPFAEEGFAARYESNFGGGIGVLLDPSFKGKAATNVDVQYHVDEGLGIDDATLNAGVKRVTADPTARNFEKHYEFTRFKGNLKIPLLTIHDDGDFFVPINLEQQYRATVNTAGASNMLVQRAIRRYQHCDFSPAERIRAWNDLVGWVTEGKRPNGEDLSGALSDGGKQWTDPPRADDPGHP